MPHDIGNLKILKMEYVLRDEVTGEITESGTISETGEIIKTDKSLLPRSHEDHKGTPLCLGGDI